MPDGLTLPTTVPRARTIARQALQAVGLPATEEGLADLIADLMHLADELLVPEGNGYSIIQQASEHYEAERPAPPFDVWVQIENTYEEGHRCPPFVVKISAPSVEDVQDPESSFWQETVFGWTGCQCKPPVSEVVGSLYEATITTVEAGEVGARAALVGMTREWSD